LPYKGKAHSRRGHERQKGSRGTAVPVTLPPGKDPVLTARKGMWAPGPVWAGVKFLAPNWIRSPACPARSESLHRLSYRGPWTLVRHSCSFEYWSCAVTIALHRMSCAVDETWPKLWKQKSICWRPDTENIYTYTEVKPTNKQHDLPSIRMVIISLRNNKIMWLIWEEKHNNYGKKSGSQTHKSTELVGQNCQVRYCLRGDRRHVTVIRPNVVLIVCEYLQGKNVYC
jgi:hypothetical protein